MGKDLEQTRSNQRAIIAVLVSAKATHTDARIGELTSALVASGVEVVGTLVQRRGVSRAKSPGGAGRLDRPLSAATFIGPGKAKELARLVDERQASVVYFMNDLTSAQAKRLATTVGCPVIAYRDELALPS